MVALTLEFIIWLIFSKYNFQKIVSYFLGLEQDFENNKRSEERRVGKECVP